MPRPTFDFEKTLPTEIAYADDVDFFGLDLEFADIYNYYITYIYIYMLHN